MSSRKSLFIMLVFLPLLQSCSQAFHITYISTSIASVEFRSPLVATSQQAKYIKIHLSLDQPLSSLGRQDKIQFRCYINELDTMQPDLGSIFYWQEASKKYLPIHTDMVTNSKNQIFYYDVFIFQNLIFKYDDSVTFELDSDEFETLICRMEIRPHIGTSYALSNPISLHKEKLHRLINQVDSISPLVVIDVE